VGLVVAEMVVIKMTLLLKVDKQTLVVEVVEATILPTVVLVDQVDLA
jgi:hypothetical protein